MFAHYFTRALAAAILALSAVAGAAHAESFALNEYSTVELGRANAGAVVQTDDASAAFGNPALLPLYPQITATTSISGVFGAAETFSDQGSTDLLGAPLSGGDTRNFLSDSFVPALHVVYPVNDRLAFGFAVNAPYGLATSYARTWPGRYQALDSKLQVINISPSVGYALTDRLSLGLGFDLQYADASLSNAIDFGAACLGALPSSTCASLGLLPQAADGHARVEGDDWSVGYNVGLAWTPRQDLRVGVHYRSEVTHELEGDANFVVAAAAAPLTAGGLFADTGASARLELPATLEAGLMWRTSDRATLFLDVRKRYWSSLSELRVQFDNPVQPDSVNVLNYHDAVRVAVAADYALTNAWTVRAGVAFDETPTDPNYPLARISDNDRTYYAVGAAWAGPSGWQIDMAYNRVAIDSFEFDRVGDFNERVHGRYEGGANVVSIGVTRRFGA
jgi:long-chain fatty acid transport protein